MPLRNRVDPWGRLIETAARGAWFGNRGCLHDRDGRLTGRKPPTDAWIICLLRFKDRRRRLLQPGRYTELFFLDEATALAAGHRPCGECRHADLRRFGRAWTGRGGTFALAREIDGVLRDERAKPVSTRPEWRSGQTPPADGSMFAAPDAGIALLWAGGRFWRWTPAGYEPARKQVAQGRLVLLTPPSTAAALARGYCPEIHLSAFR